jgi:ATP-binding cassette, subfamily A (ABC1), member 3
VSAFISPAQKKLLEDAGFSSSIDVNFTVKPFENHEQMIEYVRSPDYMQTVNNPGLCFGFSIIESSDDDIELKMAFSGTF